jgi:hypothetical protein
MIPREMNAIGGDALIIQPVSPLILAFTPRLLTRSQSLMWINSKSI